ncbi:hypothetical protein OL229_16115 [Neisseriaceae bacterium JH1-16]|nr:hypothetical protein [Neisseriaceae bacterium JH1-16]
MTELGAGHAVVDEYQIVRHLQTMLGRIGACLRNLSSNRLVVIDLPVVVCRFTSVNRRNRG